MAAQPGRTVLLKIDTNGAGSFSSVGGLRTKSMTISEESVDITDSDSAGRWRELLAAAGVRTISISGGGVFKDSATEGQLLTYYMAGTYPEFQLVVPGLGTFEGPFQISTLEYAGEYNAESTFSVSLESAGEITFT